VVQYCIGKYGMYHSTNKALSISYNRIVKYQTRGQKRHLHLFNENAPFLHRTWKAVAQIRDSSTSTCEHEMWTTCQDQVIVPWLSGPSIPLLKVGMRAIWPWCGMVC